MKKFINILTVVLGMMCALCLVGCKNAAEDSGGTGGSTPTQTEAYTYMNTAFYIETLDDTATDVSIESKWVSSSPGNMEYSTDGSTWDTYTIGFQGTAATVVTLKGKGSKVYFRTPNGNPSGLNPSASSFSTTLTVKGGTVKAGGNMLSLVYKDFSGKTETDIKKCFESFFIGCALLKESPVIPKITGSQGVGSLFYSNCTGLEKIKVDKNFDWGAGTSTLNWVSGVPSTGTFVCASSLDTSTRDASHVPTGWTVENW